MSPVHAARDLEVHHVEGMQASGYTADERILGLLGLSTPLLIVRFQAD